MADRPAPDIDRGPRRELSARARRLVERAGEVDRPAAAHARLLAVRQGDARGRRRQRALTASGWLTAVVAVLGGGWLLAGPVGVAEGAGLLVVTAAVQRRMVRAAARRGAAAWDWRARRYRLVGNPAAEVQALDGYGDTRDQLGRRPRRER
ncbi:MAG TPA: hypothetical protein VGA69_04905 [Nitriliruptorales bacterium]